MSFENIIYRITRYSKHKRDMESSRCGKTRFDFETREKIVSQRDFAKRAGAPRSTLRYWLARKDSIDAHPVLIEFFEYPVGIAFLHRLVTSTHLSFIMYGAASIHNISDFLERSGPSPFVASSYSAQRRASA